MRRLTLATLLLLATMAGLGAIEPARAHLPEPEATRALVPVVDVDVARSKPAGPPPVDSVVLILTASLIAAAGPRRAAVGLLIVLLAVFAFAAGLHSVHHLGEQRAAARCVVESATSNLACAIGEPMAVAGPAETADLIPPLAPGAPPQRSVRPGCGRSPPFLA